MYMTNDDKASFDVEIVMTESQDYVVQSLNSPYGGEYWTKLLLLSLCRALWRILRAKMKILAR